MKYRINWRRSHQARMRQQSSMDRFSANHRTHTHTHSSHSLEFPASLMCLSLHCGRELGLLDTSTTPHVGNWIQDRLAAGTDECRCLNVLFFGFPRAFDVRYSHRREGSLSVRVAWADFSHVCVYVPLSSSFLRSSVFSDAGCYRSHHFSLGKRASYLWVVRALKFNPRKKTYMLFVSCIAECADNKITQKLSMAIKFSNGN